MGEEEGEKMKKILRKPLMWLMWKILGKKLKGTRVICMHSVEDKEKFRQRMVWLGKRCAVIPLTSMFDKSVYPKVVLTFDDGSETWFDNVIPVLNDLGMWATFFTNSTEIADRIRGRESAFRWNVGGHTRSHKWLGDVVSYDVLQKEIEPRTDFAYPWGTPDAVNPTVVRWLENNYKVKYAFTCVPGWVEKRKSDYLIPRDSLDLKDPEWFWEARLSGAYDWLYRRLHKVWWE